VEQTTTRADSIAHGVSNALAELGYTVKPAQHPEQDITSRVQSGSWLEVKTSAGDRFQIGVFELPGR
jgi:hypothetical protein